MKITAAKSMEKSMTTRCASRGRDPESGYTLLIVLLMVATILLITAAAAPNIYIQGRRDRDEDMIWRGQQYVRAIGLYYKKYGKYPQTIDDLTNSNNQIRFLRQAYKDPMNTDDGSWRLIYLGAGGVLINSVMYTNIAQVGVPGLANSASGATATGAGLGAPIAGSAAGGENQPAPLEGEVIGGNLVGVGSKVKKPSIKVYNGGTTYYEWEFIWKPVVAGQAGAVGGSPAPAVAPAAGGTSANPSTNPFAPASSPMPGSSNPAPGQSQ
jgi:type II secretory pathway pseudopilin PulG